MNIMRNLILTIDLKTTEDYLVKAMQAQINDWLTLNKIILPSENLIILPCTGETRLYWLEGEYNTQDKKSLEEIKDRLEPVLQVALDLKIDKAHRFKDPRKRVNAPRTRIG